MHMFDSATINHARTPDLGLTADLGDPGDELVEKLLVIATSSGIAGVDPEPLAQTAGDGIPLDPVATTQASCRAGERPIRGAPRTGPTAGQRGATGLAFGGSGET